MVLYVCSGISREEPDVGAIIREIAQTGGESDGGRATPCNVVYARMEGDEDTI
jgi:hypothetical protein